MKIFLAGLLLLVSQSVFATGKLQFQPSYYMKAQKYGVMGGLVIAEHLLPNLMYIQWTGIGTRPFEHSNDITWFGTRHDLETYVGRFAIAVGVGANYGDEDFVAAVKGADYNAHVKLTYKIW